MNRADTVRQILLLEEVAEEAKRLAAIHRDQLAADARKELEKDGTAPTWRMPDVATVVLPVSKQKIEVSDVDALMAWVAHRHPDEVETVSTTRIRPAYMSALNGELRAADDVVVLADTGEVVPGMAVRPGGRPGTLRITAESGVKAVLAVAVAEMMGTAQAALTGPVVEGEAVPAAEPSFSPDGDPFALFPPTVGA